MHKQFKYIIPLIVCFVSCVSKEEKQGHVNTCDVGLNDRASIKYAKLFSISENDNTKALFLFREEDRKDTLAKIYRIKNKDCAKGFSGSATVLHEPVKRIASLSCVYSLMLTELKQTDKVIAVENIDYYNNMVLLEKFKSGGLKEISKGPKPDIEKTILLKPQIVFNFGMNKPEPDPKLTEQGIKEIFCFDHLEQNPLARAEWIKFFAFFTDSENLADSLFNETERKYLRMQQLVKNVSRRPLVLTEIKTGELWYVPGGKSCMAKLLKDAGAKYPWEDNQRSGSLPLGFEEVITKAKEADYWINLAFIQNKNDLIKLDSRYGDFKAFQRNGIYNNTLHMNNKGYSDYWESGIVYPDRIISDLIQIFHPELRDSVSANLYYYKRIN